MFINADHTKETPRRSNEKRSNRKRSNLRGLNKNKKMKKVEFTLKHKHKRVISKDRFKAPARPGLSSPSAEDGLRTGLLG